MSTARTKNNGANNGSPVPTVAGPRGGRLKTGGTPGNKGGGRPPDEFKAMMRELGSSPEAMARLKGILASQKSEARDFLSAHKHVIEHGYGKAPQPIEGGDERKPLTIRLVRERSA